MHPLLATAVRASRLAGNVILKHADQLDRIDVETKGRKDYVSDVDRIAEQKIVDFIRKSYPDHGIIAEEGGVIEGSDEYIWIVDPLDGTTNFLHGYPHVAVSIGIKRRGVLEHGVIYNPFANELFTTTRGQGAQLNDRRLRCSETKSLDNSLLATGFPVKHIKYLDVWMRTFRGALPRCHDIRRSGSAALDLAYVAAGRVDGYWEWGLSEWDMAAGALMVREAGGLVADLQGSQDFLDSGNIVAANSRLFSDFLNFLRKRIG
jgi:myo-inositol-1(or 4)-monophosphatase